MRYQSVGQYGWDRTGIATTTTTTIKDEMVYGTKCRQLTHGLNPSGYGRVYQEPIYGTHGAVLGLRVILGVGHV